MTDDPINNASDALAAALTRQHVAALSLHAADDVVHSAMTAALNVALGTMPYAEVSAWLRRLADTVDEFDPAAPGRAN